jgi:hypothetical protein
MASWVGILVADEGGLSAQWALDFLVWGGLLFVLIVLAGGVVIYARQRALGKLGRDGKTESPINQIERLYRAGQMTDEEYRRGRQAALGLRSMPATTAPAKPEAPKAESLPPPGDPVPPAADAGKS